MGYGDDIADCPSVGVDKNKQCCSRAKGFVAHPVVDKIQCSAENAAQAKNTPLSPDKQATLLTPCGQWVYFYDDEEGRCKDKILIPTLDPKDPKNNCRLNDLPIPTGDPTYINPNFKNRKCIAVNTAIGNISTEPQEFVKSIFNLVLGLAGGIALILIIISGYKFMASSGNPEATKAATEQLTSAIIGLLFIIFAFVILEMIGVDILKIPGFKP